MEFTAVNGNGGVGVHVHTAAVGAAVVVDFNIFKGNGGIVAVCKNTVAGVFGKHGTLSHDIVITAIQPDAAVRVAGKGNVFGRNVNTVLAIYGTGQVAQGQGLAGQYQRVIGRFCAAVHLNAVGRAGEDTAGAALFIVGSLFVGQGKGVGVLAVAQGDFTSEGIAVQVQGDGVIHGGSRDLLAHIGQQVDAGIAVLILGRIQRGLQGGEVLGTPIEDGTAV